MVEPPKPKLIRGLAKRGLEADLEEYERLLSQRFATDPSVPATKALAAQASSSQARLDALAKKLLGEKKRKPVRTRRKSPR